MRHVALTRANEAIKTFLGLFPNSFPPLVINISDGKPTDGNPLALASALKELATSDGNVLFFNAHLSSSNARPVEFPADEKALAEIEGRLLFRMSSTLPPKLQEAARTEGFSITANSRGFVFNADLVSVIRFLDIGTRVDVRNLR